VALRLGVDVGGTFTDLLLYDETTGAVHLAKVPSTPADQSEGVLHGIDEVCRIAGRAPAEVSTVLHGTTVATNTVLTGTGARVGLLVTEGFRYLLHLARSWTPGPLFGWMIYEKPDPIADVEDTLEVPERIDARGRVVRELDLDAAVRAATRLRDAGVEVLTVCLLNAYANPAHERELARAIRDALPELPVSISSDVLHEFREYERATTTVMNAYVQPRMRRYLTALGERLAERDLDAAVSVVRSDGGLMSIAAASATPVQTMLSGPSGGVGGALLVARRAGFDRIVTFDMGGTSTDVALCLGAAQLTRETQVGEFPVKAPSVDVQTIGAGGGSIASVSPATGSLRVGPQSAGADPGPAAYGRGGTEATVTDANLVLGHLTPRLVGGAMELDVELAREAVSRVAEQMGAATPEQAAAGMIDIVNENMLGALRVVTVQRGVDPRTTALVAFGGAGPLHANALGRLLGAYPVIVPPDPGVLSALGFVAAGFANEFNQTLIRPLADLDPNEVRDRLTALGNEARGWLADEGVEEDARSVRYAADLRYRRQGYEIAIDVDPDALDDLAGLGERFDAEHQRLYGFTLPGGVEVVNIRATGVGRPPELALAPREKSGSGTPEPAGSQRMWVDGGFVDAAVYERTTLGAGHRLPGPAIVTQYDSTTLILPAHVGVVHESGSILIWPEGGEPA
jgi:N-methylhydantoinase A